MTEFDSHGFPRTSGIFETIKTVEGKPIALARHMRRALQSCKELKIPMPDEELLRRELQSVLSRDTYPIGRLRMSFYKSGFHISHVEYQELTNPARLTIYPTTVVGSIHKQFPYDFRFELLNFAQSQGFDDCVLLNSSNNLTESAVSNLLFRISGEWVTPPISAGLLPGVVRAVAVEECGVKVSNIHISAMPDIESGFLLSSLRIAQPISHIGDMRISADDATAAMEAGIRSRMQPLSVG
jgi:branched-chain amino acid aminotransferase